MKADRVLFLGSGDLAVRAGATLLASGCEVAGARRSPAALPEGFRAFAADYLQRESLSFIPEFDPHYVVTSFKPVGRDVEGYRAGFTQASENLLSALDRCRPRRIFFVSSTRVFAEQEGGWVDEDSPRAESDQSARAMTEAETLLRSAHPVTAIYFSGIYGDPGGRLLTRIRRGELCAEEPAYFSNRIHRVDAGECLAHLVNVDRAAVAEGKESSLANAYIGSDDQPVLQYEVERWLAQAMSVAPLADSIPPPRMSPGHKRCRNGLLRGTGFELRYPDYRSGYTAVLAEAAKRPG